MDSVVGCDPVVSSVFSCPSNCVRVNDVDVDWVGEYGVELRSGVFHLILAVQDSNNFTKYLSGNDSLQLLGFDLLQDLFAFFSVFGMGNYCVNPYVCVNVAGQALPPAFLNSRTASTASFSLLTLP